MGREPRRFSDLRPPAPVEKKPDADSIDQVLGRLAGTRDGQLMLAWMRDEALSATPGIPDAMLREANGVRAFIGRVLAMASAAN